MTPDPRLAVAAVMCRAHCQYLGMSTGYMAGYVERRAYEWLPYVDELLAAARVAIGVRGLDGDPPEPFVHDESNPG
jgi:hypothetical protein